MVYPYPLTIFLLLVVPGLVQLHAHPPSSNPQRTPLHYPDINQLEHLSLEDGLSNTLITAIIQDRAGFMWFGTKQGLKKYDGHTFTVFQPDLKQPNRSFRDSHISGLCEGSSDEVWVATAGGGLHEVNQKTGVHSAPHSAVAKLPVESPAYRVRLNAHRVCEYPAVIIG